MAWRGNNDAKASRQGSDSHQKEKDRDDHVARKSCIVVNDPDRKNVICETNAGDAKKKKGKRKGKGSKAKDHLRNSGHEKWGIRLRNEASSEKIARKTHQGFST